MTSRIGRWWALDVDWLEGHNAMQTYGKELREMSTDERRSRYMKFRSPTGPSRSRVSSQIVSKGQRAVTRNHLDVLEEDGLTETQSLRTSVAL